VDVSSSPFDEPERKQRTSADDDEIEPLTRGGELLPEGEEQLVGAFSPKAELVI
jgi:hypothetical protein